MIRSATADSVHAQAAARQFGIRDLLLATLVVCLILGGGRHLGGVIVFAEDVLLGAALFSIVLAAACIRRRAVWYCFLGVSLPVTALFIPGGALARGGLGIVASAHLFFAALPVIASSPLQNRWRWVAAAAACQLAAAAFTPANPLQMVAVAAPLAWGMAVAAVIFHYRTIPRALPPDVGSLPPPRP